MQTWRVDRIEGNLVILENADKTHTDVLIAEFVGGVREGDVVYRLPDGKYAVSAEATAERKKRLLALQKSLFDA